MRADPLVAVTFDFWETLVQDTPENLGRASARRVQSLAELLASAGCARPSAAVEEAHERCWTIMIERFWTTNCEPTIQDQVRLFFDCLDEGLCARLDDASFARAVDAYGTPALEYPPVPMPGAVEALSALSSRGIRLGIVSNTGRTPGVVLRRILAHHDMLRHFDAVAIAYSDEVGFRKPDPRIFERSLNALGVEPARALHVGDNPDADVLGAQHLGMRAAHYAFAGAAPSPAADLVVKDLAELPRLLMDV
ncbi:MAG TPA: HAD family hydrolase [Candidatus Acidoferrum sp.]|nr:HAD family hydrolase [Candidatus Acidoferrum sp.]